MDVVILETKEFLYFTEKADALESALKETVDTYSIQLPD